MEASDGAERWWRLELVVRGGGGFRCVERWWRIEQQV